MMSIIPVKVLVTCAILFIWMVSNSSSVSTGTSAVESTELKCMFVYSNDINDFGYVFAYEKGRIEVEKTLTHAPFNYSLKTNFWIARNVSTAAAEMVPFINQGYTVFLFNGGQFVSTVNTLAVQYPTLKFLGTSAIPKYDNTAMVMSRNYQWYFLNGLICGMVTKTDKVAYLTVLGTHADPYLNTNAFWYGATLVNPSVQVQVVASNSYSDDVIARYAVDKLVNEGIDCLAINQNTQTANIRATQKGIVSCGTSSDTRFSAGELVFTSGMRNWDNTLFAFIKDILDNNWVPRRTFFEGFNQSALTLAGWSTLATEPQYDLVRSTVENWKLQLEESSGELLFCGELATLSGTSKLPGECMNMTEILNTHTIVPGVVRGPNYTRDMVTVLKYINPQHAAAIVVLCLVAVCSIILLATIVHIKIYYRHEVYKASSPLFMMFILNGMLLVVISCVFWSMQASLATCAARTWIAGIGWSLIMSALLAKTHRVYKIFSLENLKVRPITDARQIITFMIGLLSGELIILIFWQIFSPLLPVTKSVPALAYNELYQYCSSKKNGFVVAYMVYNIVTLFPVVLVAWVTRSRPVAEQYNESSAVGVTSAITILTGIIVIGATVIVKDNVVAQYVLPTLGLLLIIMVMYSMIFIPKILFIHEIWEESSVLQYSSQSHTTSKFRSTSPSKHSSTERKSNTKSTSGNNHDVEMTDHVQQQ